MTRAALRPGDGQSPNSPYFASTQADFGGLRSRGRFEIALMQTRLRIRYPLCLALTGLSSALAGQIDPARLRDVTAQLAWPSSLAAPVSRRVAVWPVLQFDFGDEPIEFALVGDVTGGPAEVATLLVQGCGRRQLRLLENLDPHQRFRLFLPDTPARWFEVTGHRMLPPQPTDGLAAAPGTVLLRCKPADRVLARGQPQYLVSARHIEPLANGLRASDDAAAASP